MFEALHRNQLHELLIDSLPDLISELSLAHDASILDAVTAMGRCKTWWKKPEYAAWVPLSIAFGVAVTVSLLFLKPGTTELYYCECHDITTFKAS